MATWLEMELPRDIPAACVAQAAQHYSVPPALVVSVRKVEGGQVGRAYPRKTRTYYGPFQISSDWLEPFASHGLTAERLQHDACANVVAASYVLAYYFAREQNWYRAVARYNTGSLRTTEQRYAGDRYARAVFSHWQTIYAKWGNR